MDLLCSLTIKLCSPIKGRYEEAFDFLHFWIRIRTDEDKNPKLKKGQWLKDNGAHLGVGIEENFFHCFQCFGPPLDIPMMPGSWQWQD